MGKRALHIGVDARELAGRPTGVGRYVRGILDAWSRDASFPHRITLLNPEAADGAGTWWEQTKLPALASRAGIDVLFAPAYTAPMRLRCPFVVVVHDVVFFAHPEWFAAREGLRRRLLTRASARRASTVITVTEFSASEIVKYLGIARDRIRLASPAATIRQTAGGSHQRAPIVLYVGSLFARRRIAELIAGFAEIAAQLPEARLILVGDNRSLPRIDPVAEAARLGVGGSVTWRDYVTDAELDELYASASVFAFLSDYEGFGIPPLEALAHGVPPVLLDTPVSREVYKDAATFVQPEPKSIGAALHHLLTDPAARADRVTRGRKLLDEYTWEKTAAVVRDALERAVPDR